VIFASIFLLVSYALVPLTRSAAMRAAEYIWDGEGPQIVAIYKDSTPPDQGTTISMWTNNYNKCRDRNELRLIFSDDMSYFILCRSESDKGAGIVFEARKDGGLVSVRFAYRGGTNVHT
jgi:hypothetical protein